MRVLSIAVALMVVSSVGGCSQQADDDHAVTVVASTDVWGGVAHAVVGGSVGADAAVTSVITGTADPHSFEASPADAAAITDATLVVYNGGGYDHWVDEILSTHPGLASVNAYALLGGDGQSPNEHVFYDPATAKAVAASIAEHLATVDASHAADFRANAAEFGKRADAIADVQRAIGTAHPGVSVVSTEPVAFYLLRNAGVTDRTPAGFAAAVEHGDDPAPADLAAMLDLIDSSQVAAVLLNPQTQTAVTKQIEAAARKASIPLVTVTETMPAGTDYLTWQRNTADRLADALQADR